MTPLETLNAELTKLQDVGCKTAPVVKEVQQDYEKLADEADRKLQEQQEQALNSFLSENS